ncbi:MAG TPA: hypothetical protein VFM09_13340 [Marmoricola sp.]|nr:hypothetical protein [Marmoricola sp.]
MTKRLAAVVVATVVVAIPLSIPAASGASAARDTGGVSSNMVRDGLGCC